MVFIDVCQKKGLLSVKNKILNQPLFNLNL